MITTENCELKMYVENCIKRACRDNADQQKRKSKYMLEVFKKYSALGRCECCTLAFIIYICFFCKNVDALIGELREILSKDFESVFDPEE